MIYLWYISDGQYTTEELKKMRRNPDLAKRKQKTIVGANGVPSTISYSGDEIPQTLNDRNIKPSHAIEVHGKHITFYVWDDDQADGDVISLNLNNKWILSNYKLTKKKKVVVGTLEPGANNFLMLYAHNEGSISPNTAGVSVFDGLNEQRLNMKSDLKTCDAVRLILK